MEAGLRSFYLLSHRSFDRIFPRPVRSKAQPLAGKKLPSLARPGRPRATAPTRSVMRAHSTTHATRLAKILRAGRDRNALGGILDHREAFLGAHAAARGNASRVHAFAAAAQRYRAPAYGSHAQPDAD